MALSDQWTLGQLRNACRRELLDTAGKWWTDTELNGYIADWLDTLQTQFDFVWGSATYTASASQTSISTTLIDPNMHRADAVYYAGPNGPTARITPRSPLDLDIIQRDWRLAVAQATPQVVYQLEQTHINIWPPSTSSSTLIFEHPVLTTLATNSSTLTIPPFCRYSCIPYVCWKAYARFGPNQDLKKAMRRKRMWEIQLKTIRRAYDGFWPEKTEMLRPGQRWLGNILIPRKRNL